MNSESGILLSAFNKRDLGDPFPGGSYGYQENRHQGKEDDDEV
jgi:hypothetical protein